MAVEPLLSQDLLTVFPIDMIFAFGLATRASSSLSSGNHRSYLKGSFVPFDPAFIEQ